MIGLQRVYRIIRPRNLSSEFNVPGWEKGVSLAARDYVDYEKQTSVLMPARITEDISLWHPGNCVDLSRNKQNPKIDLNFMFQIRS